MARQDVNQEFNAFVGGILTEANPINYPPNFSLEHDNFILQRNGVNRKRQGLDYEDSSVDLGLTYSATSPTLTSGSFLWKTASDNIGNKDVLVQWSTSALNFFDADDADDIGGNLISSATVTGKITAVGTYRNNLIVASTWESRTVGTYSYDASAITIFTYDGTTITDEGPSRIFVRDFPGLPEAGVADTTRPGALTADHAYNLINQGWNNTNITAFQAASVGNLYPSNADNMNTGLNDATGVFTTAWVENSNNIEARVFGGRYPVDIFNPNGDRRAANVGEGYANPTTSSTNAAASIAGIAEFGGRAFYLCNSPGTGQFGTAVLAFSKANVQDFDNYGNCYSTNDPTARDFNQPLDTDGGFIDISFIGRPVGILPLKSRILVFGSKGVYEVLSRQDIVRPQDLSIRKISDIPPTTTSIILTGGAGSVTTSDRAEHMTVAGENVYYMGRGGIFRLTLDPNHNQFVSQNLTASKIQTLYNEIPSYNKAVAKGVYVPSDQTLRYMYRESTTPIQNNYYGFNKELVYDEVLDAWYTNTLIDDDNLATSPIPMDYLLLDNLDIAQSTYPVNDNLRYIVQGGKTAQSTSIRFAYFRDTDFVDFNQFDGTGFDYEAVIQTGYVNGGDSQRYKQNSYIVPSFLRTETGFVDDGGGNLTPVGESSCTIQAYWDYADENGGAKLNAPFEAYRLNRVYIPSGPADTFDYGQSVITTKNRVTGRGRALSMRFTSGAGKDCRLLGWGWGMESNTKV